MMGNLPELLIANEGGGSMTNEVYLSIRVRYVNKLKINSYYKALHRSLLGSPRGLLERRGQISEASTEKILPNDLRNFSDD